MAAIAAALTHPHNLARESFVTVDGHAQPAPTPRYSKTVCDAPRTPAVPGRDNEIIHSYVVQQG